MESFVVSARKYRPAGFDEVTGQDHITSTLRKAIISGQLAQAFLFCGPRGVGKTTCARILARAINCSGRNAGGDACGNCESCKSFSQGQSLNIYELDAASNNGVDDIRQLIEQVRFAPQLGTRKVYIIDEVHMLSNQAFNAFLKTLEEPPKHAIFILATTEKHKIIPTILSRCQVFDFNRIEDEAIISRLLEIAGKENLEVEKDALHLIAERSDGSLRDALSLLDQMVTFTGGKLTYSSAAGHLGVISTDYFFTVVDFITGGAAVNALKSFDSLLKKGFDGQQFMLGLAGHLRNLLVAKDGLATELISAGPSVIEKYVKQAEASDAGLLLKYLNLAAQCEMNYKVARNQRLHVELCLINMAAAGSKVPPEIREEKKSPPVENKAETNAIPSPAPVQKPEKTSSPSPAPGIEMKKAGPVNVPVLISEEVKQTSASAKLYDRRIDTGTLSISSFTKQATPAQNTAVMEEGIKYTEEVSNESLQETWLEMLRKYDKEGMFSLHVTLSKYKPSLTGNNTVEFSYDNKAQYDSIMAEKQEMLGFLRSRLRNDLLQLKLTAAERKDQKAYTPTEKLEKMMEGNPNINRLRNNLDLELI